MKIKPIEWSEEIVDGILDELIGETGLGKFVIDCWKDDYILMKTPWDPEGAGWYREKYTLDEVKEKCEELYHQAIQKCFIEDFSGEFDLCKRPL